MASTEITLDEINQIEAERIEILEKRVSDAFDLATKVVKKESLESDELNRLMELGALYLGSKDFAGTETEEFETAYKKHYQDQMNSGESWPNRCLYNPALAALEAYRQTH
ncbi:hypothetical protein OAL67_00485 [bacterium]|nr:hypothetical protein [bacterium]